MKTRGSFPLTHKHGLWALTLKAPFHSGEKKLWCEEDVKGGHLARNEFLLSGEKV